jgi:hypothetical protein
VRHVQAKGATQAISRLGLLPARRNTDQSLLSPWGTASDDEWAHAFAQPGCGLAVRPLSPAKEAPAGRIVDAADRWAGLGC